MRQSTRIITEVVTITAPPPPAPMPTPMTVGRDELFFQVTYLPTNPMPGYLKQNKMHLLQR